MDKNEKKEMFYGVVFGAVVVIAAILETIFNGASLPDVFGAIKDIAGTLIVFVVLIAYIKEHKKVKGVRGSVESMMKEIEEKYNPLIRQGIAKVTSSEAKKSKLQRLIRYEIAADCNVIYKETCNDYLTFFDFDLNNLDKVEFYIRKKFFLETEDNLFDAEKIANRLKAFLSKRYKDNKMEFVSDQSGGKLVVHLNEVLEDKKQLEQLISIIDDMIFIYVLEKKA